MNVTFYGEGEQLTDYGESEEFFFGFVTAVLASETDGRRIIPLMILLSSKSNSDTLFNKNFLADIHVVKAWLKIHCNVGAMRVIKKGHPKNYRWVRYSENFVANILPLSRFNDKEVYQVWFDNRRENEFL